MDLQGAQAACLRGVWENGQPQGSPLHQIGFGRALRAGLKRAYTND